MAKTGEQAYTCDMETIIRPVDDLPATDRQTLEHLLGQTLSGGQQVIIMALSPGVQSEKTRAAARGRLQRTFARAAEYASETGVSPAEADAAVEEAMQAIRPRT